jgi:type I restriction enzyme R subunit
VPVALPIAAYRDRAERAVQAMVAVNPVLQKLQAGAPISDDELRDLAAELRATDLGIDEERLRKVYDIRSGSLVQLLRHVLGLEHLDSWTTTVSREFDQLIANHTFSALQIQFLRMIKTFLNQTGRLERQHLVDRPFTQLHPAGARGVFPPSVVDEILAVAGRLAA